MKKFKIAIAAFPLAIIILLSGVSCKKTFFTGANRNTNAPDSGSITPNVLLPNVESSLAYATGGDLSRYSSLFTQQTLGSGRQAQGYYGYTLTSVDLDQLWGNMYTAVMENNKMMMNIADARKDNGYGGISRVLMAYSLQVVVDSWGSVPYSDAFKGAANLQPSFDTDTKLYDTIQSLLNVAIAKLGSTGSDVDKAGATGDDFIYGGSAAKWIKFAHAIKARLYIHQAKGNAAMATNALAEIAQSFTSNADNAVFTFGSSETAANPWYQFNEQRTGDISYANSTLATNMKANNDPRYTIFTDPTDNDVNGVGMGNYYGNVNSPVEFISYDELLFMKAEATVISGGTIANAQTAYQAGIQANMDKLGVASSDASTYIAANGSLPTTSTAAAIAKISSEEFTALYLNPEAWTLWRRNASPALTPTSGSAVPRRLLYPQTEYSYNGSHIPSGNITLFTPKVFWDK